MKEFIEQDPYNPENTIEGIIYGEKDGKNYGCIQINKINGEDAPQYIYATPKFKYPNEDNKDGEIRLPTDFVMCNIYDKLDGTNILLWRYEFKGKTYNTFKTRLTPFLKDSGYSTWIKMWGICQKKYESEINNVLSLYPNYNIAFEMYGSLNPIIIQYNIELDCRLLYGIDRKTGNIVDPYFLKAFKHPTKIIVNLNHQMDVVYNTLMENLEETYQRDKSVEGVMIYLTFADKTTKVYKCKPPSVKEEFAKANNSTPKLGWNCVYTTAVNALENITTLDELYQATYDLLLEEFSTNMLDINIPFITKVVEKLKDDLTLRDKVKALYKDCTFKFPEQKGEVMRYLMKHFSKDKSTKVYHAMCYLTL